MKAAANAITAPATIRIGFGMLMSFLFFLSLYSKPVDVMQIIMTVTTVRVWQNSITELTRRSEEHTSEL